MYEESNIIILWNKGLSNYIKKPETKTDTKFPELHTSTNKWSS